MNSTAPGVRAWPVGACCGRLAALLAGSLFAAVGAQAQTPACEQLKATLATRIEATGVRGYSFEAVTADTPVPRDARVIGTCEGGSFKILYRRWGAAQPSPAGSASAAPAPAVVPASAPAPAPARVKRSAARAAGIDSLLAIERAIEQADALPPPAAAAEPAAPGKAEVLQGSPPAPAASAATAGFIAGLPAPGWHWLWALLLLPIAAGLWAWHAHRSAYDEAGLPRGPRL